MSGFPELSNMARSREEEGAESPGCPAPWLPASTAVTSLFQLDDGCAWPEAVPGSAVVVGLKVGLHDVVDGERGQHPTARVGPLHCIAFQGPHLQEVLLPRPCLR